MVHELDDPPEFTGSTQQTKADPSPGKAPGGSKRAAPVKAALAEEMASPVPTVAIYHPPVAGESHPKIARLAVAQRLDAAEANLISTQLELQAATSHLRSCELIEGDAHGAFIKAMPGPTADEVHRDMLAKDQAAKLERVAQGLPAVEPKKIAARSPMDLAAAQRPRTSQAAPTGTPLRSNVVRRTV